MVLSLLGVIVLLYVMELLRIARARIWDCGNIYLKEEV